MGKNLQSYAARWARYMKMASQARTSAASALSQETRNAYLELAKSWATLARGLEAQAINAGAFETRTFPPGIDCDKTVRIIRSP